MKITFSFEELGNIVAARAAALMVKPPGTPFFVHWNIMKTTEQGDAALIEATVELDEDK